MLLRARSVHAAKTLILERVFAEVWNCKINGQAGLALCLAKARAFERVMQGGILKLAFVVPFLGTQKSKRTLQTKAFVISSVIVQTMTDENVKHIKIHSANCNAQ